MLELIDQSDPQRMIYRCSSCQEEGISSVAFAQDGRFFDANSKPQKWVLHKCGEAAPAQPGAKRGKAK